MFPVALLCWGCVVALDGDGTLVSRPTPLGDDDDEPTLPVDLVCEHFLRDVNAALGTAFEADQFPFVGCEGHEADRAAS